MTVSAVFSAQIRFRHDELLWFPKGTATAAIIEFGVVYVCTPLRLRGCVRLRRCV